MSLPKNADPIKSNFADSTDGNSRGDSCCSLLTGYGRSAIAVIGVRGANAVALISQCFAPATRRQLRPGQVRCGSWAKQDHGHDPEPPIATAESVVVVPLADNELEIHCHGGRAASARIIDDLRELGARCVDSAEWIGDPHQPLLIREAEQVLSACLTASMAAIAMDQIRGAMLDRCYHGLAMLGQSDDALEKVRSLAEQTLSLADLGVRLGHRYRVVLLGPPNVGKSSLVNAMAGYARSITMDLAGTTRDVLHADTVFAGVPVRLSDTAGVRASIEPIEQQGVARAQIAAEEADLIVLVGAPGTPLLDTPPGKRVLRVLNKADLIADPIGIDDSMFQTVATSGQGIDELIEAIAGALVHFPVAGTPVPVSQRQIDLLQRLAASVDSQRAGNLLTELIHGPAGRRG